MGDKLKGPLEVRNFQRTFSTSYNGAGTDAEGPVYDAEGDVMATQDLGV